jgi:hypothetical protein
MLRALSLENLERLDFGIARETFDQQIKRIALDCLDRPESTDPRKVIMEVIVRPIKEQKTCEHVDVQIKVKSSIPEYHTKVYDMKMRANGLIIFNEDSPDNPDQSTIAFEQEWKEGHNHDS